MPYHDPDYGDFDLTAHRGEITLHRESAATGILTSMPLGTCAAAIARDILCLSGQASATIVQSIADTLEARALAGDLLGVAELLAVAETLRRGVGVPLRTAVPGGVVVAFQRRVVA